MKPDGLRPCTCRRRQHSTSLHARSTASIRSRHRRERARPGTSARSTCACCSKRSSTADQILVVTFTKAATAELHERIRSAAGRACPRDRNRGQAALLTISWRPVRRTVASTRRSAPAGSIASWPASVFGVALQPSIRPRSTRSMRSANARCRRRRSRPRCRSRSRWKPTTHRCASSSRPISGASASSRSRLRIRRSRRGSSRSGADPLARCTARAALEEAARRTALGRVGHGAVRRRRRWRRAQAVFDAACALWHARARRRSSGCSKTRKRSSSKTSHKSEAVDARDRCLDRVFREGRLLRASSARGAQAHRHGAAEGHEGQIRAAGASRFRCTPTRSSRLRRRPSGAVACAGSASCALWLDEAPAELAA